MAGNKQLATKELISITPIRLASASLSIPDSTIWILCKATQIWTLHSLTGVESTPVSFPSHPTNLILDMFIYLGDFIIVPQNLNFVLTLSLSNFSTASSYQFTDIADCWQLDNLNKQDYLFAGKDLLATITKYQLSDSTSYLS